MICGRVAPETPCKGAWRRHRWCRRTLCLWADSLLEVQRRKVRRHHLCRRQAPLHGVSGATRPQIICPQRHFASIHRLIQWRVTELYDARWRRRRRRCREDCVSETDRLEDWKFRDREGADTAYVGARRPCTVLLGQRVRKSYARNVIARPIKA